MSAEPSQERVLADGEEERTQSPRTEVENTGNTNDPFLMSPTLPQFEQPEAEVPRDDILPAQDYNQSGYPRNMEFSVPQTSSALPEVEQPEALRDDIHSAQNYNQDGHAVDLPGPSSRMSSSHIGGNTTRLGLGSMPQNYRPQNYRSQQYLHSSLRPKAPAVNPQYYNPYSNYFMQGSPPADGHQNMNSRPTATPTLSSNSFRRNPQEDRSNLPLLNSAMLPAPAPRRPLREDHRAFLDWTAGRQLYWDTPDRTPFHWELSGPGLPGGGTTDLIFEDGEPVNFDEVLDYVFSRAPGIWVDPRIPIPDVPQLRFDYNPNLAPSQVLGLHANRDFSHGTLSARDGVSQPHPNLLLSYAMSSTDRRNNMAEIIEPGRPAVRGSGADSSIFHDSLTPRVGIARPNSNVPHAHPEPVRQVLRGSSAPRIGFPRTNSNLSHDGTMLDPPPKRQRMSLPLSTALPAPAAPAAPLVTSGEAIVPIFANEAAYQLTIQKPAYDIESDCPKDEAGKRVWVDKIITALRTVRPKKPPAKKVPQHSDHDLEKKAWEIFIMCRNDYHGHLILTDQGHAKYSKQFEEFDSFSEQMDAVIEAIHGKPTIARRLTDLDFLVRLVTAPVKEGGAKEFHKKRRLLAPQKLKALDDSIENAQLELSDLEEKKQDFMGRLANKATDTMFNRKGLTDVCRKIGENQLKLENLLKEKAQLRAEVQDPNDNNGAPQKKSRSRQVETHEAEEEEEEEELGDEDDYADHLVLDHGFHPADVHGHGDSRPNIGTGSHGDFVGEDLDNEMGQVQDFVENDGLDEEAADPPYDPDLE